MSNISKDGLDLEYEEYLTFPEIFQSPSIATHVVSYLDIKDSNTIIILFGKQFKYIIEDKLFNVFTKLWDCKNIKVKLKIDDNLNEQLLKETSADDKNNKPIMEPLNINVANFFDKIRTDLNECTYDTLLEIYLRGYEEFNVVLKAAHSFNRSLNVETGLFKNKYNILEIAQIIINCLEFVKSIEFYDHIGGSQKLEVINFLKELFVNECLNKLHNNKDNSKVLRVTILALLKMNENMLLMDYYKSLNDLHNDVLSKYTKDNLFEFAENNLDCKRNAENFTKLFESMLEFFNKKCSEADTLFDAELPLVFVNYMEEAIGDTLLTWSNTVFDTPQTSTHFEYFYNNLLVDVLSKIETNGANSCGRVVMLKHIYGFVKLYYGNDIQEYLSRQISDNNKEVSERFMKFEKANTDLLNKENETFLNERLRELKQKKNAEESDENPNNSKKHKSNFLRSFQHMLKIGSNSDSNQEEEQLEIEYNLKKLENDIGNIRNLIDLPLCIEIIQISSNRINNIMSFLEVYSKLNISISTDEYELHEKTCEMIYENLLNNIDSLHLSKAFERSLKLLVDYKLDPEDESDSIISPLSNFSELINVSDIILQLLQMFYKNDIENIHKKVPNQVNKKKKTFDFLNQLVIKKKNFELKIDDYVANGLNIGITKLLEQIEFIYTLNQSPKDYCPDEESKDGEISTCCLQTVNLLELHCKMITESLANKATLEVYNQEITERLFQYVLKNLKKNIVNVEGGKNLINDLNYYLKFVETNLKARKMNVLFKSLIKVSEIYTIDFSEGSNEENVEEDSTSKLAKKKKYNTYKAVSKDIAKRICNPNLYLGVFTQDEVYELVGRRIDWYNIKPFVDKAVYGLDCVIC